MFEKPVMKQGTDTQNFDLFIMFFSKLSILKPNVQKTYTVNKMRNWTPKKFKKIIKQQYVS